MDWDDLKPKPVKAVAVGDDLTRLSIAELDERVVLLEAEIVRIKAAADAKRRHTAAADALFGKGG